MPCAWAIRSWSGGVGLAAATGIIFAAGCWAAGEVMKASAIKDPGAVAIDEIVGQWVVLLGLPLDPLPTSLPSSCFGYSTFGNRGQYAGRTVTLDGGLGVMLDDLLAGVYAACALSVLLATGGALGVRS
ncbi:MAG: phosphatidylglycerophosphatase A [Stellaceae bacterium]